MCDVTAAVVAGTAVMGAAAAASSKPKAPSQTSTTSTPTSGPQSDAINAGIAHAENNFRDRLGQGYYRGDLVADQDPRVQQALNAGANYATGPGGALATNATNAAGTMIGATGGFVDRAGALATTGAGTPNATAQGVLTNTAQGVPLATTGATGTAGQGNMATGVNNAQGLVTQAQGDPAMRALTTGGAFANDPVVQQQIDNAALDVTRNFNENTSPSLNARASAGGNMNSARAGIAEGLARRDAGEAVGRIAAQVRGNAFNQGVDASMTGNAQNNALALGANQQVLSGGTAQANLGEEQRQFDGSTRLAGATTLGSQDTANRALDVNTRLEANSQTGEAAFRGFDAAGAAGALVDANTGRVVNAGANATAVKQQRLDEAYEQWNREYAFRQAALSDFMGVAGANYNTGASTTTTVGSTPQSPNILQGALGGAMMGAGMSPYFRTAPSVGAPKTR